MIVLSLQGIVVSTETLTTHSGEVRGGVWAAWDAQGREVHPTMGTETRDDPHATLSRSTYPRLLVSDVILFI